MNITKKIILIVMACVMTVGVCDAKIRFGVKAGANFNSIHYNKESKILDPGKSCGWTAGAMTEFTIPIIGIGVDASLMYSRMNNAASTDYNDVVADATDADMSYGKNFLDIPINIKYKLSLPVISSYVKPMIFTGPCFSFKLDKSLMDKTFQCAWNIGIGVELIKHLQIAGSYGFGINDIAKGVFKSQGVDANVTQLKAKNNFWTITAAWVF